ncbi:MAG TPA: PilW family protein [Pseudomonadales bacterium]|jgi:type IV pilus assembly protein PilW
MKITFKENAVVGTQTRSAGFSLVELLLALALGLVVVAGIVQLFVGNSQTSAIVNGQARLQENARFAFDFISRAARQAGYLGCAHVPDNIVKNLNGPWNLIPEYNLTRIVDGYEAGAGGTWTPSIDTVPGGLVGNVNVAAGAIDTGVIAPGTDVVVFRNVQQPGQKLVQTLQPLGNPVVTAPGGDPGFGVGDVVLVANCEQAAMFRVTALAVAGNEATVLRATGGSFFENAAFVNSPNGTVPATLSFLGRSYGPEATIGAVESTYFFIAPSVRQDNRGNTPLALWQKVGAAGPVELIQGIEDLQVLYGIDTTLNDGIANPNRYVPFDSVPLDVGQIVAVRATITVNSVDVVTEDGNRLRRTFSKTIQIRNSNPEV